MAKTHLNTTHPKETCWGCDRFCPAHDRVCEKSTARKPHPIELGGDEWLPWTEANGIEVAVPPRAR
ncbi:MAG TPA: DUF3079 domain-containing protein [Polyangiaceae bacterium]|nr:DUF3079 domain-containing protein [Polyangiaceae bacterium]